jgi:hypothetical protein
VLARRDRRGTAKGNFSFTVSTTVLQLQKIEMKRPQVISDHAVKGCAPLAAGSPQVGFGIARESILFERSAVMPLCEDEEGLRIDTVHTLPDVAPDCSRLPRIDAVPMRRFAGCSRG